MAKQAKLLPFAERIPEITILSDHATQGRSLENLENSEIAHIADRDLLTLESRLSSTFDILRHKNTQCPLAIAIYGDWGTGKTSAMRWLQTQLNEWNSHKTQRGGHPCAYPVWFDPWRYHTKEEVWRGIIAEVILSLFRFSSLRPDHLVPQMVQAAKKFGSFLGRSFLHALASMDVEIEPQVAGNKAGKISFKGEAFREIWQEWERTDNPQKAHLNQFEDTLRTWITDYLSEDKALSKEHARIILFIDDLDRCLPEVAMEVLEALKLYLNIPNLIFVVGLDRDVVNAVVSAHYARSSVPEEKARHYLHKIFQVDLTIPPSEAQMGSFMQQQIIALNKSTSGYWETMLKASGHQETLEKALTQLARHNPREVKRLLNSALIRGRTAANDSLLDGEQNMTQSARALRFAQGVQMLLLQRHIQERLLHCEGVLIPQRNLEWLEAVSHLAIESLEFNSWTISQLVDRLLSERMTAAEREHLLSKIDEDVLGKPSIERSPLIELLQHLEQPPLIDDYGKPLDPAFWRTPLFWHILSVPFSQEVAQSVPRIEALPIPSKTTPDALLAALPDSVRQRLAQTADIPVNDLSVSHLGTITDLDFGHLTEFTQTQIPIFLHMGNLQRLNLSGCKVVNDLSALSNIGSLERLNLSGCTRIKDLSGLQNLKLLWVIDLTGCTGITDLSPLSGLSKLQRVFLDGCIQISDLSALAELFNLQRLYLRGCTKIKELSPLKRLVNLQLLSVTGCPGLKDGEVKELKISLPECDIIK